MHKCLEIKFRGTLEQSVSVPPAQSMDYTPLHCILCTLLLLNPRVVVHMPFIIERESKESGGGTKQ